MSFSGSNKKIIIISILVAIIVTGFLSWRFLRKAEVKADLALIASDISFIPQQPVVEDSVVLTVKVSNSGRKTAKNISVQFFDDDPKREGKKMGEMKIDTINSGQNKETSIEWQATFGIHKIYVLVDPQNQIKESNEENNEAVAGMVVGLPVIETKELSEKEFLEDPSIKELNDIAESKGYTQLVSANHTKYAQEKESKGGVLFSEDGEKVSYLIKFEDKAFLIEREGKNIILTSKDGKVEIKDGKVLMDIEEDYHSCDYNHCVMSCTIYFLFFDDIWGQVTDTTHDLCEEALKTGNPKAIAAACTAYVASYVGPALGCATNCSENVGGNPCNWCLTDDCGPSGKTLDQPQCDVVEKGNLYQYYETGYRCEDPLESSSQCVKEDKNYYKTVGYCKYLKYRSDWECFCPEDSKSETPYCERRVEEGYCNKENRECAIKNYIDTKETRSCAEIFESCPRSKYFEKGICQVGQCVCCNDNSGCPDELDHIEYICYDSNTRQEKSYFNDYSCKERDYMYLYISPEDSIHQNVKECVLGVEPKVELGKKIGCPAYSVDYGSWTCDEQNLQKRKRLVISKNYYCEGGECKLDKKEKMEYEICPGKCLDGKCIEAVECSSDAGCPSDTWEWADWKCQDDGKTLKRQTYWWNDNHCSADSKCLVDSTKTKTETKVCPVKCLVNECVEEEGSCRSSADCQNLEYEEKKTSCDGNTLATETVKYKYYCQDRECIKQTGIIEDAPIRESCPKKCSNGQCVECADNTDCNIDYIQWGGWFCFDDSTLKRTETRYKGQCVQNVCLTGAGLTGNEETKECLINEICQSGACVKKYGLIVGSNGLTIKYLNSSNYSILSPPSGFSQNLYGLDFYPGGALIAGNVGSDGKILRYDGQASILTTLPLFPEGNYTGVAFRPGDQNYALIVGDKIVEWELGRFNHIAAGGYSGNDIVWKPDGSYALVVEDGQVLKFIPSPEQISSLFIPDNILQTIPGLEDASWSLANLPLVGASWKPNGFQSFIISDVGVVLKYDGSSFSVDYDPNHLPYEFNWQDIDFKPDGQYALIVGSGGLILKYDGASFSTIPANSLIDFSGVAWISNSQALIVGGKWVGGSSEAKALLYDANSGILTEVISGISGTLLGVSW